MFERLLANVLNYWLVHFSKSISNSDLLKMIDIKMNEGIPANYLYTKCNELQIDLEKWANL